MVCSIDGGGRDRVYLVQEAYETKQSFDGESEKSERRVLGELKEGS